MALVHADRVKETSTTTGTGTYSLAGAVTGFRGFVAGIGSTNTCYYCAEDGTDWEVGLGTVTDATPDTLARTTVLASSNAGAAVNWGAGTRTLFVTLPASKFRAIGEAVLAADLPAAADAAQGAIELAIQSEMETATDVVRAVTPGRQHFHPGHPKVWCKAGVTANILASYNMTSVTDGGNGLITFNTNFSSADWCAQISIIDTSHAGGTKLVCPAVIAQAAGTCQARTIDVNDGDAQVTPTTEDPDAWYFSGYGDHA